MFPFISSYVSLSLFWFPQKIDAQAIEEFYGLTSDISKNSESGYILFYQSRDWAGRSDWQDGRVWFVRDRIRLIGRLEFFWHSSAPCSIHSQSSPFSSRLISGALHRSINQAPGRSSWYQSDSSPEAIAIWFAVVSLACFVLPGTHKKCTYTHLKWATHMSWWPENWHCTNFFFPTTHSNKFKFDNLVHFTFAGWCHDLWFGTMSRSVQKRLTVLHPQMFICSVKHLC